MRFSSVLIILAACSGPLRTVATGDFCAPVPARPTERAGFAPYGHAHNDYQHGRPLLDALDQHFYSVEADLWLRGGVIVVSHDAFTSRGTLKALYLDPLQARIDERGSVYDDGQPFVLWLELKTGDAALRDALAVLLSQYPMLTVFNAPGTRVGPVTAVLTGNAASKRAYVNRAGPRRASRDDDYSPSDPPSGDRWQYQSLAWSSYFTWDGTGSMPLTEQQRLGCLVGDIHRKGRKVRFYAAPETLAFFTTALAAGVDFLNADDLAALHDVLSTRSP